MRLMISRLVVPVVATAVLLIACAGEATEVPTEQHLQAVYHHEPGVEMRYLVWLPERYGDDRNKSHPLIVFLHGSGDPSYDSPFVLSYGLPSVLAQGHQPADFDFVVLSPQAFPGTTWYSGNQPEVVDGVVQEVLDTYLVDPNRVYLTGLSMGGYGSWHVATRFPERYAAMASLSGSGYQSATPPPPGFACRLTDVPVWGIHGERDLIAEYGPIRDQVLAWETLCGSEVQWTAYPEEGHFSTYERAYRDPALYEWMLGHTKGRG